MCYILLTKQIGEANAATEQAIREVVKDKMSSNRDGFYIGTPTQSVRTLDSDEAEAALESLPVDGLMTHSRFATTGEKSQANVHGYELDNFIFAHNGQVYEYTASSIGAWNSATGTWDKVQSETDSLMLFQRLAELVRQHGRGNKKIVKAIKQSVKGAGFWGRAMLYDKLTDRLFIFGDWHIYLFNKAYLLISSAVLTSAGEAEYKTHGFNFEDSNGYLEQEYDGIGLITNWSKPYFQFTDYGELEPAYATHKPASKAITTTNNVNNTDKEQDWNRFDEAYNDYHHGTPTHNSDTPPLGYPKRSSKFEDTLMLTDPYGRQVECYVGDDDQLHDVKHDCCVGEYCDMFETFLEQELPNQPTEPLINSALSYLDEQKKLLFNNII